jgi:hypothetical protein
MGHTKGRNLPAARPGRPPAGTAGEKVSDYAQITMRLPGPTKALLDAISGMTGMPSWRVLEEALDAYVRQLPEEEQRVLNGVRRRRARAE